MHKERKANLVFAPQILVAIMIVAALVGGMVAFFSWLDDHIGIDMENYAEVSEHAAKYPEMRPMIRKALADDFISMDEFAEIDNESVRAERRMYIRRAKHPEGGH